MQNGAGFWDEAVVWVQRMIESDEFDDWERDNKMVIGQRIAKARDLFFAGEDFISSLQSALLTSPTIPSWQEVDRLIKALKESPESARRALKSLWDQENLMEQRFEEFVSTVPTTTYYSTNLISALHMAMGTTDYPPYKPRAFGKAAGILHVELPPRNVRTEQHLIYQDALNFMDKVIAESAARGVMLRDRLDAQGVIYTLGKKLGFPSWDESTVRKYGQFIGEQPVSSDSGKTVSNPAGNHNDSPTEQSPANTTMKDLGQITKDIQSRGLRLDDRTIRRYHLALKSRGFVILAGVSGTGKTWLAEAYAAAAGAIFLRVAVAPNWTANEDLIGYFNPVDGHYHHTATSHFLGEAAKDYAARGQNAHEYHLLLDEMNLARIEHYFATFLSAMEEMHRNGTAQIPLGKEEPLNLTPNVKLIGTVNIDETTQGFADKVFDRAQLIELRMEESSIRDHLGTQPWAVVLLQVWAEVRTAAPFAFRVIDDIRRYVELASSENIRWQDALDEQIEQKILPKLSGNRSDLYRVLGNLQVLLADNFPLSAQRAESMKKQHEDIGFVSFFS